MIKVVAVAAMTVALTGCFSIQARSDYYAGADFGGFETYAWIGDMPFLAPPDYVYPPPYRGLWQWPGHVLGPDVETHAYTEGVLTVDIFDESTKEPVWHGWATRRITDADLARADERIRIAVREILADFPPEA